MKMLPPAGECSREGFLQCVLGHSICRGKLCRLGLFLMGEAEDEAEKHDGGAGEVGKEEVDVKE